MEALKIEESIVSPRTVLDKERGVFEIMGNSYMSNPVGYYDTILDWLNHYLKDPLPYTKFVFNLEYANSTTKKLLYEIICKLTELPKQNKQLEVVWYYSEDDEDMIDTGKHFEKSMKFPFVFVCK